MIRLIRYAIAIALLIAVAVPTPAQAAFESRFAELRAELEHRRDDDLAGPLDRAGTRRLAAV